VKVEVVLGEAGQADGVVAQRSYAALDQRVRRDLHDQVGGAAGHGLGEQALQLERERGRKCGGRLVVDQPIAGGSDAQVRPTGGGQHRGDEVGDRRLAVGAGDAGQAQVRGRLAEAARGQQRGGAGGVGQPHVRLWWGGDATSLEDEDGGAGGRGLGEEGVAVMAEAGDREEGEAGGDAPGVDREALDLGVGAASAVDGRELAEQGAEAHARTIARRDAAAPTLCAARERGRLESAACGCDVDGASAPARRFSGPAGSGGSGGRRRGGRRACCRRAARRPSPTGRPSRSG
jgi:hypothetical protein